MTTQFNIDDVLMIKRGVRLVAPDDDAVNTGKVIGIHVAEDKEIMYEVRFDNDDTDWTSEDDLQKV